MTGFDFVHWFWKESIVDQHCVDMTVLNDPENHFYTALKLREEAVAFAVLAVFTATFFAVRAISDRFFAGVAKFFGIRMKEVQKFCECSFYTSYYIFAMAFSLHLLWTDGWWISHRPNIWIGWPLQPLSRAFRAYYLMEIAFYVHAALYLTRDTRRKDFVEMVIHHGATLGLVVLSWWHRYTRIGLVVLILHNWADIFLYLAKVVVYVTHGKGKWKEILFTLFAINFFISRLYFFPLVVLPSAYWDSTTYTPLILYWFTCNLLLWCLQALHVFWFFLILRMVVRLAKGTLNRDIRSDGEEDEPQPRIQSDRPPTESGRRRWNPHMKGRFSASSSSFEEEAAPTTTTATETNKRKGSFSEMQSRGALGRSIGKTGSTDSSSSLPSSSSSSSESGHLQALEDTDGNMRKNNKSNSKSNNQNSGDQRTKKKAGSKTRKQ